MAVRPGDPSQRGFYRFSATWENTRFYNANECAELREHERTVRSLFPGRQEALLKGVMGLTGERGLGPRVFHRPIRRPSSFCGLFTISHDTADGLRRLQTST